MKKLIRVSKPKAFRIVPTKYTTIISEITNKSIRIKYQIPTFWIIGTYFVFGILVPF